MSHHHHHHHHPHMPPPPTPDEKSAAGHTRNEKTTANITQATTIVSSRTITQTNTVRSPNSRTVVTRNTNPPVPSPALDVISSNSLSHSSTASLSRQDAVVTPVTSASPPDVNRHRSSQSTHDGSPSQRTGSSLTTVVINGGTPGRSKIPEIAFASGVSSQDRKTVIGYNNVNAGLEYSQNTSRSSALSYTKSVSSHSLRSAQTKFSDYSSADENDDLSEKTDYTYSRSFSYICRDSAPRDVVTPNMSRYSLRTRNGSSAASTVSETTDYNSAVGTRTLLESANRSQQNRASYRSDWSQRGLLSYGLDYDSDLDVDEAVYGKSYRRTTTNSFSEKTVLTTIYEYTIFPIVSACKRAASSISGTSSSVYRHDSRTSNRPLLTRTCCWCLPLLLLLIPLLLLALFSSEESSESSATAVTSTLISSAGAPFFYLLALIVNGTKSVQKENVPNLFIVPTSSGKPCPNIDQSSSIQNLQSLIMNIQQTQKGQLSRAEVEQIVRMVVNEEMQRFADLVKSNEVNAETQAKNLLDHSEQLIDLREQMGHILSQSMNLAAELKKTKESIVQENKSGHQEHLERLEINLDSLRDNIRHIQDTQAMLLENTRNCCRNHTFDKMLVESQVATILLQITGDTSTGPPRGEVKSFINWLKTSFVGQSDLEKKLSLLIVELSARLNKGVSEQAASAAKLAAAAELQERIQEYKLNISGRVDHTSQSLDENGVKKIVQHALSIYDADKTGMADFALESAGGSVVSTRCSEAYTVRTAQVSILGIPLWYQTNSPRTVIQPNMNPGDCWAFKGSEGYLVIQLTGWVRPTAFSLEHISSSLAPEGNIDSAPKEFSVYGMGSDKQMDGTLIGRYIYNIHGEPLQYFPVVNPDIDAFPIVELKIHSNHGNVKYTCLYRFRVHGKLVKL